MSNDGNFVLSWDLHEQSRTSTLKSLWENEDFLDVTIACDDDQISAHKLILSAASPFFQSILKRNPHSHPLLYLRGTTKKDILSLLDFIYSGETRVLQEDLEDFMALANSLQVKGLSGEEMGTKESTDIVGGLEEKDAQIDERKSDKKHRSLEKVKRETAKSRNEIILDTRKVEIPSKEDIVEVSVDVSEMESDIVGIMEKYGSDEVSAANDSLEYNDVSDTSLTEYEEKVLELVGKSELGWSCTVCTYARKSKGHVREHVQEHIEGFSHECQYCDKSFGMKRTLRQHVRKCKATQGIYI